MSVYERLRHIGSRKERSRRVQIETPQKERLRVINYQPGIQKLLYDIRSDAKGGESMRSNLFSLGFMLASEYLATAGDLETIREEGPFGPICKPILADKPLVVAIPRGGVPMGQGIAHLFDTTPLYTNDGAYKVPEEPLLPSSFPHGKEIPRVVLTDAITATGGSVDKTIQAINDSSTVAQFIYITAIATPPSVDRLLQKYPNLTIVATTIEPSYSWKEINGKQVLFVNGVGDVGDLVDENRESR